MRASSGVVAIFMLLAAARSAVGQGNANWPQFRGPNASGLAARGPAPTDFGPNKAVVWKRALPAGHSSPAVWGDRIFLTAFDPQTRALELLCLSTRDGAVLWRHAVEAKAIEKVHAVSNSATATPVVDTDGVYAYFASYGVVALDHAGKLRWAAPLPMPPTNFGSGSSPVLHGDLVVVNRDAAGSGSLLALDRRTGKEVWKADYLAANVRPWLQGHSTPVAWRDQLIVHRRGLVEAYNPADGRRIWWVDTQGTGTSTVVTDGDAIYAATWSNAGEEDQKPPLPDFATLLKEHDKDADGKISASELPPGLAIYSRPDVPDVPDQAMLVSRFFPMLDQNKDGGLNDAEWQQILAVRASRPAHGVIAIKPEEEGNLTSKVVWTEKLAVPEVPSPLLYENRLYVIRNGGILSCLDAASGKLIYRTRIGAPGPYYSSPVAANGRIYLASGEGIVTVLAPGDRFKVQARNDIGEPIFATPAIVAGTLYLRTTGHLYAFR
jgi:outer membrane protein assembly factor BamB